MIFDGAKKRKEARYQRFSLSFWCLSPSRCRDVEIDDSGRIIRI